MTLWHCWACNNLFPISRMNSRRWCTECEAEAMRRGGPAASQAPGGNPPCLPGADMPEGAVETGGLAQRPPPQGLLWETE